MAWEPYEKWLNQGFSPLRLAYWAVSGVILSVTVYGYIDHPHHPGAVWYLFWAAVILAAWLTAETIRWKIKHDRLARQMAASPPIQPPRQPVSPKTIPLPPGQKRKISSRGSDIPSSDLPTKEDLEAIQELQDRATTQRVRIIKQVADFARWFNKQDGQGGQ